ncbi:MAG TPA: EAL domain-containing response regulator [Nitrospira sp.]
MENQIHEAGKFPTFGRRKIVPRACVVDGKQHIREFLREALEELGFIARECAQASELDEVFDKHLPDLVVLGLSSGSIAAGEMLTVLVAKAFDGKVLLFGPRNSHAVETVRDIGDDLGIVMLPPLVTPFGLKALRSSIVPCLPVGEPPCPPVDAAEAMREGWLELWYQPKVDTRTQTVREAEGLIRIRHPTWGVVPPAYFVASDGDPQFCGLSEFVIGQAIDDWHYFFSEHDPIELAINLPITFLQDRKSVENLCRQMPDHADFPGMIIEVNGSEAVHNLPLLKDVAGLLRFHNIAISIDDLGAEWPSFVGFDSFPFVELKVDRKFIAGCANDRLKRVVCRQILELADRYGSRTVAEGVETWADFAVVRDMGFDLVQGFLFSKPMTARKFRVFLTSPKF